MFHIAICQISQKYNVLCTEFTTGPLILNRRSSLNSADAWKISITHQSGRYLNL